MSASKLAMEAQPDLFKLPTQVELERYPELGDCQICHQVIDLKKLKEHSCGD